ncbi:hypothetical protein Tco_1012904 [Tanacetum coccineum]
MALTPHPMITDPQLSDSLLYHSHQGLLDTSSTTPTNKHCKGDLDKWDQAYARISLVNDMKITQTQRSNSSDEHQFCQQSSGLWGRLDSKSSFHQPTTPSSDFLHSRTHATVHDGHNCFILTETNFPEKAPVMLVMNRKRRKNVLDAEAEAIPTLMWNATTTWIKGPNAAVCCSCLEQLDTTSATNNSVSEGRTLDSDAEQSIDDNTSRYHQYLLDTEAQKCSN